jgi:glycosyltransferase involved in cell wall biosynthesis
VRLYSGPLALRAVRIVRDLLSQHWDIVHLHMSAGRRLPWIATPVLRFARARKIVTVHSSYILDLDPTSMRWRVLRRVLAMADHIIAVNETVAAHLRRHLPPKVAIDVAPAYLPSQDPQDDSHPELDRRLHRLRACGAHLLLISGTAQPTWGFHRAVRVMERLRPDTALLIASYGPPHPQYKRDVRSSAARLGKRVAWVEDLSPNAFAYVLARCDALLRPTTSDGDSVAVREALALGVPVVASDVTPRPGGAIVFPLEDEAAFAAGIEDALSGAPPERDQLGLHPASIVWNAYRMALGQ